VSALRKSLAAYLELRRGLGFKLRYYERRLGRFVSFVEERGAKTITTQLAVQFATCDSDPTPRTMAGRLSEVRSFARYQLAYDPATEVPPRHLLANGGRPAKAYLYSETEIVRLLRAARNQPELDWFPGPLWPRWRGSLWYCYFGMLAVTGMRLSEVRHLRDEDIDWKEGVLTIRQAKFDKSRLVPLHATMLRALRAHIDHRDRFFAQVLPHIVPQRLFVTSRGTTLGVSAVNRQFRRISHQIGLRGPNDRRGPRLHDLRHRFAVETLLRWYRNDEEPARLLPVLSTYLGHTRISCTYWYLRSTPELMAAAGHRLERRWKGVR
jgi:integrase